MTFFDIVGFLRTFIASLGSIIIAFGSFRAFYNFLLVFFRTKSYDLNLIRLQIGNYIILGLEFLVAADIIGSISQLNYYDLGIIAVLVVIRSILAMFLNFELKAIEVRK